MDELKCSLFPLQEKEVWALFKECQTYVWRADEIDLKEESTEFFSTSEIHQRFIKLCTSTAILQGALFRTLSFEILQDLTKFELRSFVGCQIVAENNHFEAYSRLLQNYIKTEIEKNELLESAYKMLSYTGKRKLLGLSNWGVYLDRPALRVIAYACIKGIIGTTITVGGLLLKREGKLHGFSSVTDLVRRELDVHLEFVSYLCTAQEDEINEDSVRVVVSSAYAVEWRFFQDSNFCETFSIQQSDMENYLQHRCALVVKALKWGSLLRREFPLPPVFNWISSFVSKRQPVDPNTQDVPLALDD